MADLLAGVDPGADFERWCPGLKPVTVTQTEPENRAAVVTVEDVPATKLIRRRSPFSVGGGSVPGDTVEFVFRADRLEFLPKNGDTITDAGGTVWVIESAALEAFDALCRAQVVIQQGQ